MIWMRQSSSGRHHLAITRAAVFLLLATILSTTSAVALAQTEEPSIVRVSAKSGGPFVGELIADNDNAIELFDFQTNRSVTVKKSAVTRIENPITLDDAARYAGLPAVMGRKISLLSSRQAPSGKIAKVGPQVVYLTLGESSGLVAGQKVTVFRGEGDIVDPDTGKVLASERPKIAELEVTEVNESVSKARLSGDLEVKLEVGDEVEPQGSKLVVAVCPLSNDDGSTNATGNSIAEQLTGALVQRKVTVVERSVLDMVLSELLVQNTVLFDEASAQKLGKLTGASVVLTGKIIQEKSSGIAHLRLIDVATGKILLAVSAPVKLTARSPSGSTSSTGGASKNSSSKSKGDIPAASGDFEELGKTRSLPKFLSTTSALKRTSDEGVRFQGDDTRGESGGGVILTRQRDFVDHDFTFEVLVSFEQEDTIAYIGIGPGQSATSRSRIDDSVYVRFHSPAFGKGEVNVLHPQTGERTIFGHVPQKGQHLVRIIKEGDALSLVVDPENDGPTDDDLELVIPDINEYCPKLNSKNSYLFISGSATFHGTRLQVSR